MRRRNIREDGVLKGLIICFAIGVVGNLAEYFFVNKNNLKHVSGIVTSIKMEVYDCRGRWKYSLAMCGETVLNLKNVNKTFRIRDYARNEPFLTRVEVGDSVDVYYPKWYQRLMTLGFSRGIYCLESEHQYFDSMGAWKMKNKSLSLLCGIFLVVFLVLYFIQKSAINRLLEGKRI